MGGMIVVVDSSASDFETGNANGNTALAEWVNYDTIRCTLLHGCPASTKTQITEGNR